MTRSILAIGIFSAFTLVGVGKVSDAASLNFNNSADINVMRQYSSTGTFLVPHTTTTAGGVTVDRDAPNDGSGWNVESSGNFTSSSAIVQQTFTLGSPASVGSFQVEWDGGSRPPTTFELRGSTDNFATSDFSLTTVNPNNSGTTTGSFTATTVNAIRYIATGPALSDNRLGLGELQVYMQTGLTVPIADKNVGGYNFLHDKQAAGQVTYDTSGTNINNWIPNNGSTGAGASTLADGLYYFGGQIKAQVGTGRAWALVNLDAATLVQMGNLGYRKGESMAPWEVYSTNNDALAAASSINAITTNTIAGIQAAGWTLQHSNVVNSGGPGDFFKFNDPGLWKHYMIVWDRNDGSFTEFELFAVPEPASLTLAGIGVIGLARWMRRRRVKA